MLTCGLPSSRGQAGRRRRTSGRRILRSRGRSSAPRSGGGFARRSCSTQPSGAGAFFRAIATTAVGVAVFLSILAIHAVLLRAGADPERMLAHLHGGVGAFSTYLVLVVPLLPMLLAPRPLGYGTRPASVACVAGSFILLIVAARATENRMVWVAFAVGFIVAAGLAGMALACTARARALAMDRRPARAPARRRRAVRGCGDAARANGPPRRDTGCEDHRRRPPPCAVAVHVRAHTRAALARVRLRQVDPAHGVPGGAARSHARARAQPVRQPMASDRRHRRCSPCARCSFALGWRYAAFLRADRWHACRCRPHGTRDARDVRRPRTSRTTS